MISFIRQIPQASKSEMITVIGDITIDPNATERMLLCDASAGAITVTLPPVNNPVIIGRPYHIKKIDSSANHVIIDGSVSELTDGELTQIISTQYDAVDVMTNGEFWSIL